MTPLWFKAKTYGYGWTPCCWQGWVVILFYTITMILIGLRIDVSSDSIKDTLMSVMPYWLLCTAALYVVCLWKGEKPRWRWGK